MERFPLVQVVKRMVCLANSRKLAGRCVAGRLLEDCQPKGWVRPVSNREHEEVSEYERQYYDGSDPKLLDVIDVPLLEPRPKNYQPENWLLDPEAYWEKHSQVSSKDLDHLTDPVADLWTNGMHTVPGNNDRFDVRDNQLEYSLRFIKLPALRLIVCVPGVAFGNHKRRVQAQFIHNREEYRLWVTDPKYEREYSQRKIGNYDLGECFATISIGEPMGGYYYKLVAAIIERTGQGNN